MPELIRESAGLLKERGTNQALDSASRQHIGRDGREEKKGQRGEESKPSPIAAYPRRRAFEMEMSVAESVEGMEPILGQAEGKPQASGCGADSPSLTFLFAVVPSGANHLRLCVSDFHSLTWRSEFSIQQLQDMKDEVGIGGTWQDFLGYMRSALDISSNVKLVVGESAGGYGATTARIVAQKMVGTPRLCLPVKKLEGCAAEDARSSIPLSMFEAFKALSSTLSAEKARVASLKAALTVEQATVDKLQEQLNSSNLSFPSRRKPNMAFSPQRPRLAHAVSPTQSELQPSQDVTQSLTIPLKECSEDTKGADVKPFAFKGKAPVGPPPRRCENSRRVRQRGTTIGESADG